MASVFVCVGIVVGVSAYAYWKEFTSDTNKCASSISDWESYYKIELEPEIEAKFPVYKLYIVGELYTESMYEKRNFSYANAEYLEGVPILFIPGNGGFHEQGRTISSILTHMVSMRGHMEELLFDYFTIDFNEEKLGLSGHYLFRVRVRKIFHCSR